jgi:hypothetical protein
MSLAEERRKSCRADVDETAYISISGSSTRCKIANISEDGAALEVPDASYVPSFFQLMTERDRTVRTCRVVWIQQNRIGVEFGHVIEEHPQITHRERQFLQYLRDGACRPTVGLPDSPKLISKLLGNGWMERSGNGTEVVYRITPKGLAAKMAPVKI